MDDNFKLEIISPEKIIFSDDVVSVTIPAYEGDMSILKNHISIITFLRPGIIKIEKKDKNLSNFFVQDGTVEFFNDVLAILSTSVVNVENLELVRVEMPSVKINDIETTSEKMAMGHLFDSKATLVTGTHTHIPTNDARVLKGGTAYITDSGMCGDYDSVIGMNKENSLKRSFKQDSNHQTYSRLF